MKNRLIIIFLALSVPLGLFAQEQEKIDPEQEMKEFHEWVERTVNNYQELYKLEDWQCFYVDSILTHDQLALKEELEKLSKNKVTTAALYTDAQDKWAEQTFNSFHAVFTDEQWAKYLKYGAARAKKERDKRRAKRAK